MKFQGIERQDEFAHALLKNIIGDGFFLDIGCAHPLMGSNSCIFDLEMGWEGLAFDWQLSQGWSGDFDWAKNRPRTQFFNMDVTTPEFIDILYEKSPLDVDYISVDVDGDEIGVHKNYGWEAVKGTIDADIRFSVMTLEHEHYLIGDQVREPTRKELWSLGYELLFADVCLVDLAKPGEKFPSEDWWIDPNHFFSDILDYGGEGLTWKECIAKIKEYPL